MRYTGNYVHICPLGMCAHGKDVTRDYMQDA